jgi:hypothetical protein
MEFGVELSPSTAFEMTCVVRGNGVNDGACPDRIRQTRSASPAQDLKKKIEISR